MANTLPLRAIRSGERCALTAWLNAACSERRRLLQIERISFDGPPAAWLPTPRPPDPPALGFGAQYAGYDELDIFGLDQGGGALNEVGVVVLDVVGFHFCQSNALGHFPFVSRLA